MSSLMIVAYKSCKLLQLSIALLQPYIAFCHNLIIASCSIITGLYKGPLIRPYFWSPLQGGLYEGRYFLGYKTLCPVAFLLNCTGFRHPGCTGLSDEAGGPPSSAPLGMAGPGGWLACRLRPAQAPAQYNSPPPVNNHPLLLMAPQTNENI